MPNARPVLASFREPYVSELLDGTTRFEVRRVRLAQPGAFVVAYNSTLRVVSGTFVAGAVVSAPPAELWPLVEGECGLERHEFDAWFGDRATGHAIEVTEPRRVPEYSLGFAAPRSYRYLDTTPDLRRVLERVAA